MPQAGLFQKRISRYPQPGTRYFFLKVPKIPRIRLPLISLPIPFTVLLNALLMAFVAMLCFLEIGRRMVLLITLRVALLAAVVTMRCALFTRWVDFLCFSFSAAAFARSSAFC